MNKPVFMVVILAFVMICISCHHKVQSEFQPEPEDPDTYDLSVWKTINPGIHSGFASVDVAYPRSTPPSGKITDSIKLHGWKGERVNCQLLVWSGGEEEQISITANGFSNSNFKIEKDRISISVVRYVLTDEFLNERSTACGPRNKDIVPAHIVPDLLSNESSFITNDHGTRPVWISVDIPADAPAGIYKGLISRQSVSGSVDHQITLELRYVFSQITT